MARLIKAALAATVLVSSCWSGSAFAEDLSPAENNKVAEKFFETAWNKGDFDSVENLLSTSVVDHSPVPGQSSGPDKFKEIVGMFRTAMPDVVMTIKDEIYNKDYVVHRWELNGTHKAPLFGVPATQKKLTLTGHTMLRFDDGKIAERWTQLSELSLLQQLGVVPVTDKASPSTATASKTVPPEGGADKTPEENNKLAETFFESAWNKGDFNSVRHLLSPDVVDHSPVPAKSSGPDKFEEIVTSFRKAMPDLKMVIDAEVYAGDKVVHRWRINGTHTDTLMGVPATGKPLVLTGITIVRLKDGKFVERWTQLDELGLLKQLGVIPDQASPAPEAKKAASHNRSPVNHQVNITEAAPANAGAVRLNAVRAVQASVVKQYYQQQASTNAPDSTGVSAAPAAAPEMTREMNLLGIRSIKAPVSYPRPKSQGFWEREFMTGNWGGLRDELHDKGLDLNLAVFMEPYWNVSGGKKKDSATHAVGIASADLYTGKAGMWQDGQFHITLAYLNGGSIRESVGAINPIVSSDALSTFRLFELWYGQKFDEGKQEIRIGKIFPYVMLGNIKSAYLFSNGSFNYPTFLGFGQSAAYFAAPFGVQYRYSPSPSWQFLAMIQDGYDDESGGTEKRNGLELSMNSTEGAEGTLEAWYKHNQAPGKTGLPGNYKAGVQFHTGIFDDKYRNRHGESLALKGGKPHTSRGNYAVYALGEQMVYRESSDPGKKNEGLNVFLKGSMAPEDVNTVSATVATGMNYVGLIPGRDRDVATVGISHSALSKAVRKSQRDSGATIGDAENVIEAVYAAQIAPWWLLEFGAQHIIHPGGSSAIPNSTVLGISSRFSF